MIEESQASANTGQKIASLSLTFIIQNNNKNT